MLRRRRRPAEGRLQVFLTPRPVPRRIAGYNPAPPVELGRVPPATPYEPTSEPYAPTPEEPDYYLPPFWSPPSFLIPPIFVAPVEPPCDDKDHDGKCDKPEEPEEPPTDVPEPGVLLILATGALLYWRMRKNGRRNKRAV